MCLWMAAIPNAFPRPHAHQEVSLWLSPGMPRWVIICHLSRGGQLKTATSGVADTVGESKDFRVQAFRV